MNKAKNILSLSMEPEMQELLKKHAKKKDVSVSKLVRDLVEKFLLGDEEVVPVILKIPMQLKGDAEGLQKWLEARSSAIIKALCKVE